MAFFEPKQVLAGSDETYAWALRMAVPITVHGALHLADYAPGDWIVWPQGKESSHIVEFMSHKKFQERYTPKGDEAAQLMAADDYDLVVDEDTHVAYDRLLLGRRYLVVTKRAAIILPPRGVRGELIQCVEQQLTIKDENGKETAVPREHIGFIVSAD